MLSFVLWCGKKSEHTKEHMWTWKSHTERPSGGSGQPQNQELVAVRQWSTTKPPTHQLGPQISPALFDFSPLRVFKQSKYVFPSTLQIESTKTYFIHSHKSVCVNELPTEPGVNCPGAPGGQSATGLDSC